MCCRKCARKAAVKREKNKAIKAGKLAEFEKMQALKRNQEDSQQDALFGDILGPTVSMDQTATVPLALNDETINKMNDTVDGEAKNFSPTSHSNLVDAKSKGGAFDKKKIKRHSSITKLNRADSPDPIDMKAQKASKLSLFQKKQFKSGASLNINPIPISQDAGKKAKSPKKKKANNLVGDNLSISSDEDGRGAYHINNGTDRGSEV